MFERLKPLLGLSLAIAGGYVLAHVIVKTGDNLYENDPDFLANLAIASVAATAVALVVWQRRSISGWLGRHKRGLAFSAFAILCVLSVLVLRAVLIEPRPLLVR